LSSIDFTLREILALKAQELFNDYGVSCLAPALQREPERLLCGILGFTGDRLCGSVVVSASETAIAQSNPIKDGAPRAWVAELTNQLVGRFKNALLRHGVDTALSIPVVLTAAQVTPLPQTQADPLRFDVGGGSFAIWLEIEAAADLTLADPNPEAMIAAEGETLLF
jgi:CheY-specific phosphatase CheX